MGVLSGLLHDDLLGAVDVVASGVVHEWIEGLLLSVSTATHIFLHMEGQGVAGLLLLEHSASELGFLRAERLRKRAVLGSCCGHLFKYLFN